MGAFARYGIREVVSILVVLFAALMIFVPHKSWGRTTIMYDFETGPEGWENEAENPVEPVIVQQNVRSGKCALAFTYTFSPKSRILHCRVKFDAPRDFSATDFRGFSAWVYIPVRAPGWEAKMFVRSGEGWKWSTGPALKNLLPGWHKVQIRHDQISEPQRIQDMGIQVIQTSSETITAQILFDQIEVISAP